MADLFARLRQAVTDAYYRHAYCPTIGCDPDWTAQVMFGLEHPSCRNCRRELP